MLTSLASDLIRENRELDDLLSALSDAEWNRPTAFFGWTVRDQVLHLAQVDAFGLASMRDPEEFATIFAEVRRLQGEGVELSEQARQAAEGLSPDDILAAWREGYETIGTRFRASDPKARMRWFGPDMSLVSFASARLMEVWAHGQDIFDMLGIVRRPTDRLRPICELGVRTFGWSFANRDEPVPPRPAVQLSAPSGALWTWPGEAGEVRGSALDFALVVTQRRPFEETALAADGEGARRWLEIAQCFAGAPQARALPGSRPRLPAEPEAESGAGQ